MGEDIYRSFFANLETNSSVYTTMPNYLTEESKYIKRLEARIINLEYENSQLKKSLDSLKELKEIIKLKPQIDSLLNYCKIDLLESLD